MSPPLVKAVILSLDNLPLLVEQVAILRDDPLVARIVVVDNGSLDGTAQWLAAQSDLCVVRRTDRAPGPGRNAGLDAAGVFDFVLTLDGGVRPLRGGVAQLLAYLERRGDADVIGLEIADMATDEASAQRTWDEPIADAATYRNTLISHTAYALARRRAFDGIRFCAEGPFAVAGWGVDDNELAFRWNQRGIAVHVVRGMRPYRRASGSFARLHRETGIWPNQYGSVYEQRVVYCQQEWPQYGLGVQHGEPRLTLLVDAGPAPSTARLIKRAHDRLRGGGAHFAPYSIVLCGPEHHPCFRWAEPRRLRQHHGDTIILDGRIVRRDVTNEPTWTGDFRVWHGEPVAAVRPAAARWARVDGEAALERALDAYERLEARAAQPERGPLIAG